MRKNIFGKQLSRDANERKALFKTLASSLVMAERIETTEAKAKTIRPYVERLVTKAKNRGLESRQFIEPYLSKDAADKVIKDLSVRFAKRDGGYTRILRLGNRFFDNAPTVVMEWVERKEIVQVAKTKQSAAKKEKKDVKQDDITKLKGTKDTTKQSGLRLPGFKTPLSRLARPASEKKG